MDLSRISIGLAGATPPDVIAALAPRIEAAGLRGLWLNDTPDGDSLAGLAAAARVTSDLRLSTGVIPLDRRAASDILAGARTVPSSRLDLGVGTGGAKKGLALVESSVDALREGTDASIVVGALGPKMRKLGAQIADGVLFNWLTPTAAGEAIADLRRDAEGREVRGILYARTALTAEALPALREEAARYGSFPTYAANFARLGIEAIDTTIDGTRALAQQVDGYLAVVDELVLRVVTVSSSLAEYEDFVDAVVAQ